MAIIQITARRVHWKTKLKPQPNEKKKIRWSPKAVGFILQKAWMNHSVAIHSIHVGSVGPTDLLSHNQTHAAGVVKNNCSECRLNFCSAWIVSYPFCKESMTALRQADWLLQQVNRHWGMGEVLEVPAGGREGNSSLLPRRLRHLSRARLIGAG